MANQGGGALRGLRLLTLEKGPRGFGFHMYTNKVLKVREQTHGLMIRQVDDAPKNEAAGVHE